MQIIHYQKGNLTTSIIKLLQKEQYDLSYTFLKSLIDLIITLSK